MHSAAMDFELRVYGSDDVEAIARVFTDSVHELARDHYDDTQRAAWAPRQIDLDEWRAKLASIQVLVADREGTLAGFIGYESDGHVVLLYTASHAARSGVASRLYERVERDWIAVGVKRAYAEVSLAARPFFESRGFVVEHEERVVRRGATFTRFAMAKAL
jgi:putative acetyltransferase